MKKEKKKREEGKKRKNSLYIITTTHILALKKETVSFPFLLFLSVRIIFESTAISGCPRGETEERGEEKGKGLPIIACHSTSEA